MNCRVRFAGIFFALVAHGCAHSTLKDFCASEIPEMAAVLRGGEAGDPTRSLASATAPSGRAQDPAWAESWKERAESAILQQNRWREAWAREAGLRGELNEKTRWDEELTRQSSRWVFVYSYATRGKVAELERELGRIEKAHGEIGRRLCSP